MLPTLLRQELLGKNMSGNKDNWTQTNDIGHGIDQAHGVFILVVVPDVALSAFFEVGEFSEHGSITFQPLSFHSQPTKCATTRHDRIFD